MTDSNPAPVPPPAPSGGATPSKGLVGRVFDLSFSEFVTPSIIKFIFVIGVILAGLGSLAILIGVASQGGGAILAALIVAPLVFLLYVLFIRVMCELYILLFRIEENTRS